MKRRLFVTVGPAALLAGLGLTACATTPTGALTPQSIVTMALAVANGLSGALSQVAVAYPTLIPPATVANLSSLLALATAAANSLSANLPATTGASTVQTAMGYINTVLNTLAGPPINGLIPAPFNLAIAAAAFLAPQLEAFVSSFLPPPAPAAATSLGSKRALLLAKAPPITSNQQAIDILKTYGG